MSRHEGGMVLIAGVWLAAAAVANAATESTSQPGGLEEVIVTAQKRSENEQTVPMSITSFTAATLQGPEPGLCADRRWRRHRTHHIDPRHFRHSGRWHHRFLYR